MRRPPPVFFLPSHHLPPSPNTLIHLGFCPALASHFAPKSTACGNPLCPLVNSPPQIFTSEPFLQLALPVTERPRGNRPDDKDVMVVDDDDSGARPCQRPFPRKRGPCPSDAYMTAMREFVVGRGAELLLCTRYFCV